jgi:ABC-type transport system involved in cytochrome c biogenesis permease subunit
MLSDGLWLPVSMALYFGAAVAAVVCIVRGNATMRPALWLLGLALVVHTIAIAERWIRVGHGPYVDLFEILSSNIWSLHLAALIGVILVPSVRQSLATALPVLQVLVWWIVVVPLSGAPAPVTYATVWLPVHAVLGKIFLGCMVLAVGVAVAVLLRRAGIARFAAMPADSGLGEIIYRLVLVAVIFESLMLVVGALWARDAWGRFWAWDPLETWAFATWLAAVGYLHLRALRPPPPTLDAVLVLAVFVIAFATFFGVPFISTAPHKGAV